LDLVEDRPFAKLAIGPYQVETEASFPENQMDRVKYAD
jgi:hypothetical protein